MEPASSAHIKKELQLVPRERLVDLCLRLARHKKENKELLSYLLFDEQDMDGYLQMAMAEIDKRFESLQGNTVYIATKGLRKILRYTGKLIRFTGSKKAEAELTSHFCNCMMNSGLPFQKSLTLFKLFSNQKEKLSKALLKLHPDLQHDFKKEVNKFSQFLGS
jgi:hypothetical protein